MFVYNQNNYFKYSELSFLEKQVYYEYIYQFLKRLALEYPNFSKWYKNMFCVAGELNTGREIILCENNYSIVGVAILKSDNVEKKICTLRVDKRFQKQGIGRKLIELSFEWLEDDFPIITMHKTKQNEFSALLNYYGFKLEQTQRHYYNIFTTELVYNGVLPEKKIFSSKIKLLDIQRLYKTFLETGKSSFDSFLLEYVYDWYAKEKYDFGLWNTWSWKDLLLQENG